MSERVRVLQIIPHLGTGGAEWLVCNLATALNRTRFEVSVASLYSPRHSAVEAALRASDIEIHFLGKRAGFDAAMFWKIDSLIAKLRPHVLHSHLGVLQYAIPAFARRGALHVVHTIHNMADRELPLPGRLAQRLSYRLGAHAVSIARAVDESFRREYGRDAIALIPNGIPVAHYTSQRVTRLEWRAKEGIAPNEVLVICVARIWPQKAIDNLLRAFAKAIAKGAGGTLLLLGDGPQMVEMKALAAKLGLGERARFLGVRSDVPAALGAADVFALASHFEGNPLSVMEAMSAGLAVVATSVGGVPELLEEARAGILVPPNDTDAFASALSLVLTDEDLRHRLGREAQMRAVERFDVAVMARGYEALYERLLRR